MHFNVHSFSDWDFNLWGANLCIGTKTTTKEPWKKRICKRNLIVIAVKGIFLLENKVTINLNPLPLMHHQFLAANESVRLLTHTNIPPKDKVHLLLVLHSLCSHIECSQCQAPGIYQSFTNIIITSSFASKVDSISSSHFVISTHQKPWLKSIPIAYQIPKSHTNTKREMKMLQIIKVVCFKRFSILIQRLKHKVKR